MGLSIGPITGTIASLRSTPEFGQARLRGDAVAQPSAASEAGERDSFAVPKRDEPPKARVGFGDGTLSPQGAALRTLDQTVDRVRQAQPSIDQIREQFQARAAERRAAAFRDTQTGPDASAIQSTQERGGVPQSSALVREFAATDAPRSTEQAAPVRAERPEATNERDRPERPAPSDVREQRLQARIEQDRADRPRLDVRV